MGYLAATILALVGLVIVIVVAWILFWWLYRRATKEVAFVRTGMGGQKVVQNGGAFVIPVLHDIIRVTMGTNRLEITRGQDRSVITRDRLRVDVTAEFYVRVGASKESIALAAQSLGAKTARPEAMRDLLEGRFVDALRTVAAEMTMEELHEQRGEYIRRVKELVRPEIENTGLELESASLTAMDQTNRDFFNPSNAFDAEGLTRLTADIEERRLKRNAIEQDSEISIQQKRLESETRRLELTREEEYARLRQQQEIAVRRAEQAAQISAEEAEAEAMAEKARLEAEEMRNATDAAAVRAMTDAENTMSEELMQLKLRLSVIDHLKEIIRESSKPMENINDIRIMQVDGVLGRNGLGSGGGAGADAGAGPAGPNGSLPEQLVDSALRYRTQAPVVDSLLAELGLNGSDPDSVSGFLAGQMPRKTTARPDGPEPGGEAPG